MGWYKRAVNILGKQVRSLYRMAAEIVKTFVREK
jgi:hypothetical protein